MRVLITGSAGFIGFHLSKRLLERGDIVTGFDSVNDYYDPNLKWARLNLMGISRDEVLQNGASTSKNYPEYHFIKGQLESRSDLDQVFRSGHYDVVCNLAAQAGVRYSLTNPRAYLESNLSGFLNILEGCRHHGTGHLVYASSSSVYGLNEGLPFKVNDNVDHPVSLYAATKKSNELMAHSYSHLYRLPTTGLRFFTVYGPWGRPDMALFLFTKAILKDEPIEVFNYGKMIRDFTYIDDIVEGIIRVMDQTAEPNKDWTGKEPDPATSSSPYRLYNIGNQQPVQLMDFVRAIEETLGKKAIIQFEPMQKGDVRATHADVSALIREVGYQPKTTIKEGIANFIDWYRAYYAI